MCSPDLRGEQYLPERHCLPLFDPRFTSSTPFALVSRLCLINAFFRQPPECPSLRPSLFPFRSRFVSRAPRSTPCLAREESFHLASDDTRPLSSSSISRLCFINAPRRHFVFVPLWHALFRLSSFIRFTPVSSTFSTFRHLASTIARPFLLHGPSLPLSFFLRLKTPECLTSTSLFAPRLLSPTNRSLPLSITLSMLPTLFLSFSL